MIAGSPLSCSFQRLPASNTLRSLAANSSPITDLSVSPLDAPDSRT